MVTESMITAFIQTFVNRNEYTQVTRTREGEWSWRRASMVVYVKGKRRQRFLGLTRKMIRQHLEGTVTVGLYAIRLVREQATWMSRCKWIAVDADYKTALDDLALLEYELKQLGVTAVVENSRRGGHLWIFNQAPLLAKECRTLILSLARRLDIAVKGVEHPEGLELFPRQDALRPGEFGNGIRGPLGVHRKVDQRFFFIDAPYRLDAQFDFIARVPRLTEQKLHSLVSALAPKRRAKKKQPFPGWNGELAGSRSAPFQIKDHVGPLRRRGRNWVTQCPSCRAAGKDTHKDNLSISVDEPTKYICWADCSKEAIRAALGVPIRYR